MNSGVIKRKEWVWLIILVAVFFALRLPAIHSPYHQDEYKWVYYSHPEIVAPGTVPHPPLTEFIYAKTLGPLFGDNNFRFIPLVFSFANLFLIFYLAKIIFNEKRTAFWVASLFAVSFYSVLASMMVDVDGSVMSLFFLIMMIGYYKLASLPSDLTDNTDVAVAPLSLPRREGMGGEVINKKKPLWIILLIVGAIGGFLIKVSGILPIFAIFLDFLIEKGVFSDKKRVLKYAGFGLLGVTALALILISAKFIFPFFNLAYSLKYWKHFANSSSFLGRGWMQTFIQFAKAVLYTSPLLILPAIFADKEIFKKTRPFFLFILIGLIFYILAFDFSLGALDRYLQFLVIPLCIISGAVFVRITTFPTPPPKGEASPTETFWRGQGVGVVLPIIFSIVIFFIQFLPQNVPPLYPKTEWLSRIISFKWNFLYPFSGGSGPLPFYVSFAFIALAWVYSLAFVLPALFKSNLKKGALIAVLVIGVLYNVVFVEEYLFGKINGSAPKLVRDSVEFIKNDPDIKKVVVYNDNGGFNVRQTGKYERRIYASPDFQDSYGNFFKSYKGHVLYINIPEIDPNSIYQKYFNSCAVSYSQKDKYVSAFVFDCTQSHYLK